MIGKSYPRVAPLGDSAILFTLGSAIDRATNHLVHACAGALRETNKPWLLDVVPAYSSFAVHYDPLVVGDAEVTLAVYEIVRATKPDTAREVGRLITIPVRYDGPDLADVATANGIAVEEVIERHAAPEYYAYAMGFMPGFAYLGDLDRALSIPRRTVPRTRVPRGSVAIAGVQTAVYPLDSPGGWHLIGSTEVVMFDARRKSPSLLRAGDRVKFERV